MEEAPFILLPILALLVSALTLVSGFGLGTLLLPAFAIFFPIPLAIGMTALVHLATNVFKLIYIGKNADRSILKSFGLPAILAAIAGAALISWIGHMAPLRKYEMSGQEHEVTLIKIIVGLIMVIFTLIEIVPKMTNTKFDRKMLPVGGILSGFFGGLAGFQGALRSAFLLRLGLSRKAYAATTIVIACMVDFSRLSVYVLDLFVRIKSQETGGGVGQMTYLIKLLGGRSDDTRRMWVLIGLTSLAAFVGAFVGARMVRKIAIRTIQIIVGSALVLMGVALIIGLV